MPAAVVVLTSAVLLAGVLFHVLDEGTAVVVQAGGQGILLVLAVAFRSPGAVSVTILGLLAAVWAWIGIWPPYWPFAVLVPLAGYGLVVRLVPPLRGSTRWVRRGRMDRSVLWLTLLTVAISSAGLLTWFFLMDPDLGRFARALPSGGPLVLLPIGFGFALLNAVLEESVYRGILLEALDSTIGRAWMPLLIQALVFGSVHFRGVPDGWTGVTMATAYGLMLGVIRRQSRGMVGPIAAHVCADAVVFCMLVLWVAQKAG